MCEQTCGNGGKLRSFYDGRQIDFLAWSRADSFSFKGDCTGPNFCTCPTGYTGFDCRIPVCEQSCSNGGWCVAPNSCQCPPGYSGVDCSMPVCHQGFFVPYHELPEWMIDSTTKRHWPEYKPCNFTSWCKETGGFDCAQTDRTFTAATPHFGTNAR